VHAVVVGRVVQRGDSVTVSAEMVDTRDDRQLWGEQYSRKLSEILTVQEELAGAISAKLRSQLTGEEKNRLSKRDTENAEAYQFYLRGRYLWNQGTPESLRKAIAQFEHAIEKDPGYAPAYVGVADGYLDLVITYFTPPKEMLSKAKAAAAKALEIDPNLAEAQTALGYATWLWDWDRAAAESHLKRGIELNPNSSMAHFRYGVFLVNLGRFDEGLAEHRRALDLDPLSPYVAGFLAYNYMDARRYDESVREAQKAIALDSNMPLLRAILGWSYAAQGKHALAIAECEKIPKEALSVTADNQFVVLAQGWVYAVAGRKKEAQAILDAYKQLSGKEYVDAYLLAAVYSGLGEKEQTLKWLERAYEDHSGGITFLKVDPYWELVREEPRYIELLRKVNLQP
jgi:tetratricopeptide (TPR) repeat protein